MDHSNHACIFKFHGNTLNTCKSIWSSPLLSVKVARPSHSRQGCVPREHLHQSAMFLPHPVAKSVQLPLLVFVTARPTNACLSASSEDQFDATLFTHEAGDDSCPSPLLNKTTLHQVCRLHISTVNGGDLYSEDSPNRGIRITQWISSF